MDTYNRKSKSNIAGNFHIYKIAYRVDGIVDNNRHELQNKNRQRAFINEIGTITQTLHANHG